MSPPRPPLDDGLDVERMKRMIDICDDFDSMQRRGDTPGIETFLDRIGAEDRPRLLLELVALEIEWRRERGEFPSLDEYRSRFAEHAPVVAAAFQESTEPADASPPPRREKSGSARLLLVGLLAVRNGFIDERALIEALARWTNDRSRPFDAVLAETAGLAPDRLALLEALAREHLEHHGDIQASLASLNHDGPVRTALEGIDFSELDAEPLGSTVGPGAGTEPWPNLDRDRATTPRRKGRRFTILRHHAQGNLGVVYLARDEELGREVALKRIREEKVDNADSRRRFLHEARITAGLEHPCIVPVYGMGGEDGERPYYAMRFIRGETLKGAVKRLHRQGGLAGGVELRRLLRRFVGVCEALAYAHSRGVLHRDLKPANVMLGPYGETLLVDFGLAKALGSKEAAPSSKEPEAAPGLDPGETMSQRGFVKGTPAFMSPEQADPDLTDDLTTASDVYALGATLYFILLGRAPYGGRGIVEILEKVRIGEYKPPRAIDRRVPRALEAICLKAMSLKPSDRYASALDMARDVERWLADEPVAAYREPWLARAGRFARRNKPLVAGVLTLMITSIVALAVDDARVGRQKARADANFQITRDAIRELRTDVATGRLAGAAVSPAFRLHFAQASSRQMERLLANDPDDRTIQGEAAEVFRETANLQRAAGRHEEADRLFTAAIRLLKAIAQGNPNNGAIAATLVLASVDQGENLRLWGRPNEAVERFREAVALGEILLDEDGANEGYRLTLAHALSCLGRSTADPVVSSKAVELLKESTRVDVNAQEMVLVVEALRIHAVALEENGRSDEAAKADEEAIARAVAYSRTLRGFGGEVRRGRSADLYLWDLDAAETQARLHLAALRFASGRHPDAKTHLDAAIRLLTAREARDDRTLATAHLERAKVHAALKSPGPAEADVASAETIAQGLKNNPRRAGELAEIEAAIADAKKAIRAEADRPR